MANAVYAHNNSPIRKLRAYLDPVQYFLDGESGAASSLYEKKGGFNLLIRRKAKENNFKVREKVQHTQQRRKQTQKNRIHTQTKAEMFPYSGHPPTTLGSHLLVAVSLFGPHFSLALPPALWIFASRSHSRLPFWITFLPPFAFSSAIDSDKLFVALLPFSSYLCMRCSYWFRCFSLSSVAFLSSVGLFCVCVRGKRRVLFVFSF